MALKRILSIGVSVLLLLLMSFPLITAAAEEEILSVGKSYTVSYDSPIENAFPARAYESETRLTDGEFASTAKSSDPAFLHLYRGTAVSVTIDLENVCAVSSVQLRTLQIKDAGIECARYVTVAVSEDGTSFGTVGRLEDSKSITLEQNQIITHTVTLEQTYRARYVRITFSSDVHTYVDEITVYGFAEAGAAVSAAADPNYESLGFAEALDGIGNIVLMYTVGNYTEQQLLPYFAYVDTDGSVTDTMFDAMLFLPSGASNYDFTAKSGWDAYTENLFGQFGNVNLTALDHLVGQYCGELSLGDDYRYPVFLAVPYLALGTGSFDGVVPDSLENRVRILSAYVDELLETFASCQFEHLELKGLYWHEELIQYTASEHEEELIVQFNQYAHSKNLKTIWIPYYCAPGFECAAELGFDAASLQSGYAFARTDSALSEIGEVLPGAVEDSAAQAQKYGLGMEFELDISLSDCYTRYYKYLHTGYSTGCMDGHMTMVYQGVSGFYSCATAKNGSDLRRIYDLTYLYNKGEFTSAAPTVDQDQIIVASIGSRASGNIVIQDADSAKSDLKVIDLICSEGLTFLLEGDGFYILNTSQTAAGLYTATFRVSDGYNSSEESTLFVLLIDPDETIPLKTLEKDLLLYSCLNTSSESVSIPLGTEVSVREITDGWYYISAVMDGENVHGFSKETILGETVSDSSEEPQFRLWFVVLISGIVLVLIIIAAVLIFVKKNKKNKGRNAKTKER